MTLNQSLFVIIKTVTKNTIDCESTKAYNAPSNLKKYTRIKVNNKLTILPNVFTIVYTLICFLPFNIAINREFNEYKIIVIPKTLIKLEYRSETKTKLEKKEANNNNKTPTVAEQYKLIFNEVLNKDFNLSLSSPYSAVYLMTPVLIAPFAKVSTILIKLEKAPIKATPLVPVYIAITLLEINPEEIRIRVIIPEKNEVLINFKISL